MLVYASENNSMTSPEGLVIFCLSGLIGILVRALVGVLIGLLILVLIGILVLVVLIVSHGFTSLIGCLG